VSEIPPLVGRPGGVPGKVSLRLEPVLARSPASGRSTLKTTLFPGCLADPLWARYGFAVRRRDQAGQPDIDADSGPERVRSAGIGCLATGKRIYHLLHDRSTTAVLTLAATGMSGVNAAGPSCCCDPLDMTESPLALSWSCGEENMDRRWKLSSASRSGTSGQAHRDSLRGAVTTRSSQPNCRSS
jgi:hypothetical protein